MKVPSTGNPEILTWVNLRTEEVRNCRQIAAINTVILSENQSNETSQGLVKLAVKVTAKGNLEHEQLPIQGRSWSIVPCSRHLPEVTQSGLSNKTARFTTRDYMGAILKDSLDMIEGLTPCQTLGKLTSQTQTERYDICWKKGSPMTGQQLYQKILHTFFNEKNQCSSESTRSPRREFGYTDVFSHKD